MKDTEKVYPVGVLFAVLASTDVNHIANKIFSSIYYPQIILSMVK